MASFAPVDITASLLRIQADAQQKKLAGVGGNTGSATAAADASAPHVSDADKATLQKKAKEFESFFIYQSMELMKNTDTDAQGMFGGGQGEEMFRHTLNERMADAMTDSGGIGLSKVIYKELLQRQEAHNATLAAVQAQAAAQSYASH